MEGFFSFIEDRTTRTLAETLATLLESASIDQITTSQIIQRSGVSRSTFYRRYLDKYDFLNKLYQRLLDDTIMKVPQGFSFRTALMELYETLRAYPVFFRNALVSRDPQSLRNYVFQRSYEMYEEILRREGIDMSTAYQRMLLTGYVSGSLEVTIQWAEQGMKEDVDVMLRLCYELMPREMQSVLALHYM